MLRKTIKKTINKKPSSNRSKGIKPNLSSSQLFELIQKRAYEVYCSRDQSSGDNVSDWIVAEKQVQKELNLR